MTMKISINANELKDVIRFNKKLKEKEILKQQAPS